MKYLLIMLVLALSSACATTPCRGVIGLHYGARTHMVHWIYPHTGAKEVGIKPGDILQNPESLVGKPGEYISVTVTRDGKDLVFSRVRLTCIDELAWQ